VAQGNQISSGMQNFEHKVDQISSLVAIKITKRLKICTKSKGKPIMNHSLINAKDKPMSPSKEEFTNTRMTDNMSGSNNSSNRSIPTKMIIELTGKKIMDGMGTNTIEKLSTCKSKTNCG
jgi:hypothetical protein